MSLLCSPVIAIFMEYIKETTLQPHYQVSNPKWYRYVNGCCTMLKQARSNLPLIFSSTSTCISNVPLKLGCWWWYLVPTHQTSPQSVYSKPVHWDWYLNWNSNHIISTKKSGVRALNRPTMSAAHLECSQVIDYLHWVPRKSCYPE